MLLDFGFELIAVGKGVAGELLFDGVENFAGGFDAEVGGEQRGFNFFENGGINLASTLGDGVEGIGEGVFGFADGLLQPFEESRFRFAKQSNHMSSKAC